MGDERATTYHRFVKTTPKPSATKNNSGELELLPPGLPVLELVDDGEEVEVEVVMMSTTDYCGRCGDDEELRVRILVDVRDIPQ